MGTMTIPQGSIICGDSLRVMAGFPSHYFDTIITDPPYGLSFMGKDWDHGVPGVPYWAEALRVAKPGATLMAFGGTRTHHRLMVAIEDAGWEIRDTMMWLYAQGFPKGYDCAKGIRGFALKELLKDVRHLNYTSVNYQCGCSDNCHQCGVLLHGDLANVQGVEPLQADVQEYTHLSGPSVYNQMDNGYICTASYVGLSSHLSKLDYQDRITGDAWQLIQVVSSFLCPACFVQLVLGASDREAQPNGIDWNSIDALHVVSAWAKSENFYHILSMSPKPYSHYITESETWQGWNVALKPAWEPIIVAQAPVDGGYVNNALTWGVAGLNVDGGRIETGDNLNGGAYSQEHRRNPSSYLMGSTGKNYRQPQGRWPANVILSHTPECEQVGVKRVSSPGMKKGTAKNGFTTGLYGGSIGKTRSDGYANPDGKETVEDWVCVPDCPVRMLDAQSGVLKSGDIKKGTLYNHTNCKTMGSASGSVTRDYLGDSGGASRFFYCAKSSKGERGEYNTHPTVKPQGILRHLARLTKTPTGGRVLDPFAGSGSTALACIEEGRDWVLIDKDPGFCDIARRRVLDRLAKGIQLELWR